VIFYLKKITLDIILSYIFCISNISQIIIFSCHIYNSIEKLIYYAFDIQKKLILLIPNFIINLR